MVLAIIEYEKLEVTGGGSFVAPVWFDVEGMPFPEAGWWDFPVVILSGWLESLAALRDSQVRTPVELRFMDGPYFVRISRLDDSGTLEWHAIDARSKERVVAQGRERLSTLARALESSAKELLAWCATRGLTGDDVQALDELVGK